MYLLDTSVVSAATNPASPFHVKAREFLAANELFANQIFISVVTLSEAMFGYHVMKYRQPPWPPDVVQAVHDRVSKLHEIWEPLPITDHIARTHALLRADYAAMKIPTTLKTGKGLKGSHVETWHNSAPPSKLQIQENDLWIAATAITHDFVLVSRDGDFNELKLASKDLQLFSIPSK